jgi:hypothetical protein
VGLSLVSPSAVADVTKAQCVDANVKAQELRRDGKLAAARGQLRACADPSCPSMVRDDCTKRLDELERAQPTIIFGATDASGADLVDVRVSMDGQPLVDHLDGKPLSVDAGAHVFTFEAAGQPPVAKKLVVAEGEKGRHERVVLGAGGSSVTPPETQPARQAPPAPEAGTPSAPAKVPGSAERGMGTQKMLGLVAGGVGVAGVAVGSVFGLMALSQKSQQESDCGGPCSAQSHAQAINDHSTAITDGTISTVGFIAGGALLVGGAALFLIGGRSSDQPAATGIFFMPSVGPGGGGMFLKGAF